MHWGLRLWDPPPSSLRLQSPWWNWQAVTLGGDPSRFSGQKVLCRAVQATAGLRDREHEVSGQKFAGLEDSGPAGPARSPSRLPRQPRPAGALGARGIVLARLPLRGPRLMAFGVSARAFHSPGGNAGRAQKRPAPGSDSRARPAPCLAAPPAPPAPPAPLPARLGGGAHSSSSSSSNSGGDRDSSGAPGRSGLRAFQRVWTSMPAGHGSGRAGTLGDAGLGPGSGLSGAGTTSGSHGEHARLVPFVAAALRHRSARALAHGRDGSTLARGAAGTPLGSLALASSNASDSCSPPLAAAAPRPAPRGRSARVRS